MALECRKMQFLTHFVIRQIFGVYYAPAQDLGTSITTALSILF
jgi:hypothetical protein